MNGLINTTAMSGLANNTINGLTKTIINGLTKTIINGLTTILFDRHYFRQKLKLRLLSKRLSPHRYHHQNQNSCWNYLMSGFQAGIRSINLISDGEKQELDDGSVIFGKTTFAKDDGTLGEVADVALKYKTSGHKRYH
jgi:hypothetical protein